jgi:predicted aspartyl protease
MGRIIKEVEIEGKIGKAKVKAFFDTGSPLSLIKKEIAERTQETVKIKPLSMKTPAGEFVIDEVGVWDMKIKGCRMVNLLHVSDKITQDIIIGTDIMQPKEIKLDPAKEDVEVPCELTTRW